jgi:invasion protein IalB
MFDSLKLRLVAIIALTLTVFMTQVIAQNAKKPMAAPTGKFVKFGNWTVACPAKGDKSGARCLAQLALVDAKRKTVLVSWRIGYNKESLLVIDLVTPTEVFVAPGVKIELGNGSVLALPYVSCGIQGCLSRLPIDAATLEKLRGAKSATIAVAATNKKVLQLKLNTTGLGDALKAITSG